jgi:hypothetical protein
MAALAVMTPIAEQTDKAPPLAVSLPLAVAAARKPIARLGFLAALVVVAQLTAVERGAKVVREIPRTPHRHKEMTAALLLPQVLTMVLVAAAVLVRLAFQQRQ